MCIRDSGKLVLPGLIDNHTHFISGGTYLNGLDLRPAKSIAEFVEILKRYVETHKGKWILGGNWDHEAWEKTDLPIKEWIDPFSENTPILIDRFDGHMALANSYALKLAGINKNTPDPAGGKIEKDPVTGEPTGILKDNAMYLVLAIIPEQSFEENVEALKSALAEARRLGITSVHDITSANDFKVMNKFDKEGALTCRIYTRIPVSQFRNLVNTGIDFNTGSEFLKLGSLKAFADGSLGSSTAWFFEPYFQDPSTSGLPMDIILNDSLSSWAFAADKAGLQLSIHAIGDKANSYILDVFEKIKEVNPEWDRRFRIEHAQHLKKSEIKRFREIGVIASVQPYHCIDDGVWAEKRIGPERIHEAYPIRTLINEGVQVCFGSDWPVAPLNPLWGIYAAATRRTFDDKNPGGWIPDEKITVEEAIKCYTINNAYAGFSENTLGSITTGKFADFIVLSENILKIDPVKIWDVQVLRTVVGGKTVYIK
ncbi:MAG: amidohydrolase, partial [Ignavibacteriaceae bacterium]|nr:amidohydrolase [Ignavibacteriaceae bacterium]